MEGQATYLAHFANVVTGGVSALERPIGRRPANHPKSAKVVLGRILALDTGYEM